jgi:two-component system cell cycle sensor histidine kinase/response regulator CckA
MFLSPSKESSRPDTTRPVASNRSFSEESQGRGILVVDDCDNVRTMLEMALKGQGFNVWLASSGLEAVEVYRQNSHQIALVLLDVHMPQLDGPQTFAALRKHDSSVRCCFMSGTTETYTQDQLRSMGGEGYLAKPFDIAVMIRLLRGLIFLTA